MLRTLLKIYIFLLPTLPIYIGIKYSNSPLLNVHRILGLAIALLFFVNVAASATFRARVIRAISQDRSVHFLVSVFFFWKAISSLLSEKPTYSFFIFALDVILIAIPFLALCTACRTREEVSSFIKVMFLGFVVCSTFALAEYVLKANIFYALAPQSMLETDYLRAALTEKVRDGNYRVQSAFMHPLALAQYICLILPITSFYLIQKRRKLLLAFACVTSASLVYLTGSRAGLGIISIQLAVLTWIWVTTLSANAKPLAVAAWICGASTIALLASGMIIDAAEALLLGRNMSESLSTTARLDQLALGYATISSNPLFGVGPGLAIDHVATFNERTGDRSVDSYYLGLAVDSGPMALALFILLIAILFLRQFRAAMQRVSSRLSMERSLSLHYQISIFGMAAFLAVLSTNENIPLLFAITALMLSLNSIEQSHRDQRN